MKYFCLLNSYKMCAVLCISSSQSFTGIREGMNYEHKRKDKEAFNKRGLEHNSWRGRAGYWKARLRHETYRESDSGTERERYSLQLDLAEQGPLICKCTSAVWMFDGCWDSTATRANKAWNIQYIATRGILLAKKGVQHTHTHSYILFFRTPALLLTYRETLNKGQQFSFGSESQRFNGEREQGTVWTCSNVFV